MLRYSLLALWFSVAATSSASDAARLPLAALNAANPWYPHKDFPCWTTPQWVGEAGVEAVVVLAIDDMRDTAKYEKYLRPILDRLKQIDGRAPVSIMTCAVNPDDPQLQSWIDEGLSIEVHTIDHPCPLLQGGDFDKAQSTYDRCIDLLNKVPRNRPVAFRTPCCDSLNTVSPRFYATMFNQETPDGNALQIDSSVFNFFTSDDESIPRELVLEKGGKERFWKYMPRNNTYKGLKNDKFVNYIKNYPYPYVINNSCWQFPCVAPSDWSAQHFHGVNNKVTVDDWKAALDITVQKQGVFNLVFHPHGWIKAEQVVELIDHAIDSHGRKVKFLTFREAASLLNNALTNGLPLKDCDDETVAKVAFRAERLKSSGDGVFLHATYQSDVLFEVLRELKLPQAVRADGTHNGIFIHDRHLCWQNEDTSELPNLIRRVSLDGLPLKEGLEACAQRKKLKDVPVPIGAATVNITPDFPVRLTGYGNRTKESEGVAAPIHARALAIGKGRKKPSGNASSDQPGTSTPGQDSRAKGTPMTILITVDNCGVPANVTEAVFGRIAVKHEIARERFAIAATHTHSGPWLRGFAPNILTAISEEQSARLEKYESELIDNLVDVANRAIESQRPGHLSTGRGKVGFAVNRRVLDDGTWTGFGETTDGPVDHQLSVLAAHDIKGRLIAVLANYACHATTETGAFNQISGDWPGLAATLFESEHSDSVALIAIGCGADANPTPRGTHDIAKRHARAVVNEISRLLSSETSEARDELKPQLSRISPDLKCNIARIDLPLGPLPTRSEWEGFAKQPGHVGVHAAQFLDRLNEGKSIPEVMSDYPVQTWSFGEDLAMVFLGGEVVVDYSIRLNEMFDSERLWLNAYSNDVPCYIASKRILREGGYEADRSMVYYAQPTRLAPETEDVICDTVQKLLPHEFYSDELQAEFPGPKSPHASLHCISTKSRLQVELVASEPLIQDPIAFDWDIEGRLWVVEMGDYPLGDGSARGGGRVRVLEDTDGDGSYDEATTFLDELSFPNGIHRWRNGVIITAAPDIFYAEDTDGDLKADVRRVLYTGFTKGNQQHRVNGLRYGLDNWLHIANGDSGGEIRVVDALTTAATGGILKRGAGPWWWKGVKFKGQSVSISGRDARLRPDEGILDPTFGRTQFGRERDDWGNWFGNNNSNPLWQYIGEDAWFRDEFAGPARTRANVPKVPGAAPVYPTSQTLSRFNDFDKANRFTSACSSMIYRDDFLGKEFNGNAFVCEPVHNLVSRLVLKPDGLTFKGTRAQDEQNSEFFASSDSWTRPTMIRTGPDGGLWVADMYRQVIEHPEWIPAEAQRRLNLRAGSKLGRIYRITPHHECCRQNPTKKSDEFASRSADRHDEKASDSSVVNGQPVPELRGWFTASWNDVSTDDLVLRLGSPNGWWRDAAQRILVHRGSNNGIVEKLKDVLKHHESPLARLHALCTACELDRNNAEAVRIGAMDPHPGVQRHAVRLSELFVETFDREVIDDVFQLANSRDKHVQMQIARLFRSLPAVHAAPALPAFLNNVQRDEDITSVALNSIGPSAVAEVLEGLEKLQDSEDGFIISHSLRNAIWALIGRRLDAAELTTFLGKRLTQESLNNATAAELEHIGSMLERASRRPEVWKSVSRDAELTGVWESLRKRLRHCIDQPNANDATIIASCRLFPFCPTWKTSDADGIRKFISPQHSPAVQSAAIRSLVVSGQRTTADVLLSVWHKQSPATREDIVRALLSRLSWTESLLLAMENEEFSAAELSASARDQLLQSRDRKVRERSEKLFGTVASSSRSEIVERLLPELLELQGDSASGKLLFTKRCAVCHRLQDVGKSIGADLAAVKDRSTQAMLTAIVDPNRAVEVKFLSYTAVTEDGLSHNGMLLHESGSSVTLMGTDGKEKVVARNELEEFVCTQRSLMPEGLEKDLSPQDLADVIAFVQSSGTKWKVFPGNSPQLVSPNSDGSIDLSATTAEIYGPGIVFEQKYQNLGWWNSTEDYAAWTVDVPKSGHWTVEIDYACDNSTAGSVLKLATSGRLLSGRVPGTGTWDDYRTWTVGKLDLRRGQQRIVVTAPTKPRSALIDLRAIRLSPPD